MASLGKAIKYSLLPGIVPRLRDLVGSTLRQLAGFIALAYGAVRLLPPTHPYLIAGNAGRFGIRDVMSAARRNLVFRRENSDQIILYYSITAGLWLMMAQIVILAGSFSIHGARAAGLTTYSWTNYLGTTYSGDFFQTPAPAGDLAFIMLDHVFGPLNGTTSIFGSCVNPGIPCPTAGGTTTHPIFTNEGTTAWPTAFQTALWSMFDFYNVGICVVGLIVFLYLVATVVGETAQSGQAFGGRFNRAWAIPRMMLAVALLMPLTSGFNGAQWITLYAAKWGSGMGTNAWILFNNTLVGELVVNPTPPGYNNLPQFMMVARTCKQAEAMLPLEIGGSGRDVEAYQVDGDNYWTWPATFADAMGHANNHDIHIVFGERHDDYQHDGGNVHPICGELTFQVKDATSPGALKIQGEYYTLVNDMWTDTTNDMYAKNIVEVTTPVQKNPAATLPDDAYIQTRKTFFETAVQTAETDGRAATAADPRWTETYTDLGWAGSAIWYNRIAEYNGSFVAALRDVPKPSHYPEVMEHNQAEHAATDRSTDPIDRYCESTFGNNPVRAKSTREFYISQALCKAQSFWAYQDKTAQSDGSPLIDMLKTLFGVRGLFDMVNNTNVNPLAQLVGIGRDMITAFEISLGGDVLSAAFSSSANPMMKALGQMVGGVSTMILGISLSIGFILYYVLPFMPFVYVFFALGGWVKAIFEAMVGLPLWAIAHIRIDGEGIPGSAGIEGYFLIFEIFIRPLLIIFGLIASISIFTALVQVLNQIWTLVVTNVAGYDSTTNGALATGSVGAIDSLRDVIDGFAYTVLYAVFVYMIGMASFKLIDQIPAQILRWMGRNNVQPFGMGQDAGAEFMGGARSGVQDIQGSFGQGLLGLQFRGGQTK